MFVRFFGELVEICRRCFFFVVSLFRTLRTDCLLFILVSMHHRSMSYRTLRAILGQRQQLQSPDQIYLLTPWHNLPAEILILILRFLPGTGPGWAKYACLPRMARRA